MQKLIPLFEIIRNALKLCTPFVDMVIRIYVALVFWKSGMVKISNMDSTTWLFINEYHVPLITPTCAAYLSTATELTFSGFLIIGFLSRASAFGLFLINVMAVLCYPGIHMSVIEWHIVWGLLLLILIVHGPGKLSVDYLLWEKWLKKLS